MKGELRRRLEAAREERRRAAQEEVARAAQLVVPRVGRHQAEIIDLRTVQSVRETVQPERERQVARSTGAAGMATLTATNRQAVTSRNPVQAGCPRCGGRVRLDMFDAVEAVAHLTCLDCHHLFDARSPRA